VTRPRARFSKVPKLFGRRRLEARNFAVILNCIPFNLQHIKRIALQNKRVTVLEMAFRARNVFGTFEKRAADQERPRGRLNSGPHEL